MHRRLRRYGIRYLLVGVCSLLLGSSTYQAPTPYPFQIRSVADCTTETGGVEDELCVDTTSGAGTGVWRCPSTGDCNGTTAWERVDDTTGGGTAHRFVADCTTETGGVANELCFDTTAGAGTGLWRCPAGGDCFTTTAWERIDDTTGGAEINDLENNDPPNVLTNEVYIGENAAATGVWVAIIPCTSTQKIQYNDAAPNTFTCVTEDATQAELDAQDECSEITGCVVSALTTVTDPDMAVDDFGDFNCGAGVEDCVLDATVVDVAELVNVLTFEATAHLDLSAIDSSTLTEGLTLPQHPTACAVGFGEGQVCWEADATPILKIGDGIAFQSILPLSAWDTEAEFEGVAFAVVTPGESPAAADISGSFTAGLTVDATHSGTTHHTVFVPNVDPGVNHTSLAGGDGISEVGGVISTASGEDNFLVDGGVTSLICGVTNLGRAQVMDDGTLEYCDGATTSVLRVAALGDGAGLITDFSNATDLDAAGDVANDSHTHDIDNLTGATTWATATTKITNALTISGVEVDYDGGAANSWPKLLNEATLTATDCDVAGEKGRLGMETGGAAGKQLFICDGVGGWERVGILDVDDIPGWATWSAAVTKDTADITISGVEVDYDAGAANAWPRLLGETVPTVTDCDAAPEEGRLVMDTNAAVNQKLSICTGVGGWEIVGGSGGGAVATDVIWDVLGDLAVGTGADTAIRLAAGANNTMLLADSGEASGLKWGTPATVQTALSLVPGTDVQVWDAELDFLAGSTYVITATAIDILANNVAGQAIELKEDSDFAGSNTWRIDLAAVDLTSNFSITPSVDGTLSGASLITNDTLTFGQISDSSSIDADTTFNAADGISVTWAPTMTSISGPFMIFDAFQDDDADGTDVHSVIRIDLLSESLDAGDTLSGMEIVYENGVANAILDSAFSVDNEETTAGTMLAAYIVTSSGVDNGVTVGFDASAAFINNAISIGLNPILHAGGSVLGSELETLTDTSDADGLHGHDIDNLLNQATWATAVTRITNNFVVSGVEVDYETGASNAWPRLLDEATPTTTDCDAPGESGRILYDSDEAVNEKLLICTGAGGWERVGGAGGGISRWDQLAAPTAATTLTSDATAETVIFSFEAAFAAATQQFLIRQQTGNPTGGTLVDIRAADTDVTVLRVGDGTNGITVTQTGFLTSEGTGSIRLNDASDQLAIGTVAVTGLLPVVNIANGLTDAQVLNSITLDNITQITTRSHTSLSDIGTDTHATIDTHIAASVAHSATGAVVGTTNTQTLTNKTISGALATTTHAASANFISLLHHATDCTAITDGVRGELCIEEDDERLYSCQPTAGGCDTAGEWILTGDGGGTNTLLDGTSHTDTANTAAVIGSLIIGVTGPLWDALVIGGANEVLFSDGTTAAWDASPAIVGTDFTGTATAFTASNVTTNANLTGPVTSSGNATTITTSSITEAMMATEDFGDFNCAGAADDCFLDAGVVDNAALTSEQKTLNCNWAVEAPLTGDDGDMHCHIPDAATLVRAYCSTDTGTSNINFYERTEAAPNTGTTGMLTANLLCDTGGENSSTFTDSAVALNSNIALGIITPFTTGWVRVSLEYTVD